ncbi:phosphoribosylaminoimidazole-succinocarboxamide synthase [Fictibacillus macauensis ZFHKF-1]|uniref:Phosphoribosylaminoimidazole-succinocarboxamide synthase n=1 Tax=Fictibacillus macauensis ZFHKF-1 TaxID=1196324 RepID=I8AGT1_9BACL|nr:phosphoribosylaminoimidazolesuccinocarboxamide synthase [Fictibacillus macauensis]EIT84897.1 phosphoribosylaminoimidazole-succinocarboxamide synthase [Fictibacillus macauensis ZFHKF-1]
MEKQVLLYEGKAKKIYSTEDPRVVWIQYKDAATAFNGEKKADIKGKGRLNNEISSLLFSLLEERGIPTHFLEKKSATEQTVQHVTIIPLEVVVRNVVAGSLAKRTGFEEGHELSRPIVEFYYKNDALGDPLFNEDHIEAMKLAKEQELLEMRALALMVNSVLLPYFAEKKVRLIDFKLEFGRNEEGALLLADEVSPDTCRLWDEQTNEKLDKDVFRRDLGELTDAYETILTRLGGALHV